MNQESREIAGAGYEGEIEREQSGGTVVSGGTVMKRSVQKQSGGTVARVAEISRF